MQNNDHNPTLSGAELQPAIALLETASVAAGIERRSPGLVQVTTGPSNG